MSGVDVADALRALRKFQPNATCSDLLTAAADEIEALRAENERLTADAESLRVLLDELRKVWTEEHPPVWDRAMHRLLHADTYPLPAPWRTEATR